MRSIPKIRKNLYLSLTAWRQIRILQAIMSKGERISEREVVEEALRHLAEKHGRYDLATPCRYAIPRNSTRIYCVAKKTDVTPKDCINCADWNQPEYQAKRTLQEAKEEFEKYLKTLAGEVYG